MGLLSDQQVQDALAELPGWALARDGRAISRRWQVKGFARAQGLANLAGWLAEDMNHHPDIAFGWGWCEITFTSHDAGGVTDRDIAAARRLNGIAG